MEFSIEKCTLLIMKSGEIAEGVELPCKQSIRTLGGNKNYKYWGIFEADAIK